MGPDVAFLHPDAKAHLPEGVQENEDARVANRFNSVTSSSQPMALQNDRHPAPPPPHPAALPVGKELPGTAAVAESIRAR